MKAGAMERGSERTPPIISLNLPLWPARLVPQLTPSGAAGSCETDAVDAKPTEAVAFDPVSGHEAEQVLLEAAGICPDATLADTAEALVQMRDAARMGDVPTKEILAAAVDALRRKHAYATHGTPEELAGGLPEILDRALKGDDRRMAAPVLVIPRDKSTALLSKYPKAATRTACAQAMRPASS